MQFQFKCTDRNTNALTFLPPLTSAEGTLLISLGPQDPAKRYNYYFIDNDSPFSGITITFTSRFFPYCLWLFSEAQLCKLPLNEVFPSLCPYYQVRLTFSFFHCFQQASPLLTQNYPSACFHWFDSLISVYAGLSSRFFT